MSLLDSLNEQVVKVPLEGTDKEEVIPELIEQLVRAGKLSDRSSALEAVEAREAACSTGIGNGLGIPHGKTSAVDDLVVALGVCPDGVEFDAIDGEPVYVVFLILSQPDNPGPHVRTLAEVAGIMKTPGMTERLASASSARELIDMLAEASEAISEGP